MNDILRAISPAAGLAFVSFEDELFLRGVSSRSARIDAEFRERGYCYGGFRFFPHYPDPILDSAKAIWLVRDPRDILISQYFSSAYSHVIPAPEGTVRDSMMSKREHARSSVIDDWVLDNRVGYVRNMEGYLAHGFPGRANVAIYRYEDVIFRKREWIIDLADWLGWEVSGQVIDRTVKAVDIFPTVSDPTKHIRQVLPGNHKALLNEPTQKKLGAALAEYLQLFQYSHFNESEFASIGTRPLERSPH